jgi:hypothetical protein
MNETLCHMLRTLEERLLDPEVRVDAGRVATLLADDFREFGKSGRVYDRKSILALLAAEVAQAITIEAFSAELLGPEAALATYISRTADGEQSRRSSVWVYRQGRWQMLFHQGTAIPGVSR